MRLAMARFRSVVGGRSSGFRLHWRPCVTRVSRESHVRRKYELDLQRLAILLKWFSECVLFFKVFPLRCCLYVVGVWHLADLQTLLLHQNLAPERLVPSE